MSTGTNGQVVLYQVKEAIATITLNRPDRLNAWTGEMERGYFDALEEASNDPGVRVIVLTGAGRGFCAGADMDMLQGIGEAGGMRQSRRRAATFPLSIPKPIVAAVNGACAGIGLVHALMCDVRFAARGAKFTTAFSRRGLVAEHGISWLLPRLAGPSVALDLLLSARVFLAEEAAELGVVNRVTEPESLMDETLAYATDLATNCSPTSMSVIKQQVYRHADADLATALAESDVWMAESLAAPDFREGVASFVEKRPPQFQPVSVRPE